MAVGLYPKEKIGFDSIVSICPANRLDTLITDWDASEEDLKQFDEQGIKVVVVDKPVVGNNILSCEHEVIKAWFHKVSRKLFPDLQTFDRLFHIQESACNQNRVQRFCDRFFQIHDNS